MIVSNSYDLIYFLYGSILLDLQNACIVFWVLHLVTYIAWKAFNSFKKIIQIFILRSFIYLTWNPWFSIATWPLLVASTSERTGMTHRRTGGPTSAWWNYQLMDDILREMSLGNHWISMDSFCWSTTCWMLFLFGCVFSLHFVRGGLGAHWGLCWL